ncbi:unnamed protein product [Rangifer tarandus platyrhynchus]|uniref:Uncharacterized protein n=3 Tax=Rangifer tarandus platyrhynchus TaxID=3082113 RepID=A0ACB0EYV8_RANTA|nr:unnamed protein product [Rangifer tarandus platyrhynchus]CAI9705552.1 unnamed protein product [Rangifer tarandus platyrhynchus]
MDLDALQVFQSELTCSICMNCFLDPVTIDCGHSFCRPCLSLCWEEGQTPRSCPECRGISERPHFKTNIVLKRLASLARQARADHDHRSEEQICETHQEARGLFCEADQTLLCGPCSERPEHTAHSHSPIHRAAEESREKLLKRMSSLWKMREEMQISLNQEANTTQSFEDYVALRKVMIKLEYQRMLLLLREEEQLHLEALEREAKEICEQLKESVFRMTQQRKTLKEMYREMMEMCHKPDVELLQGLDDVLEMSESAQLHMPQPLVPELLARPMSGLLDWLNRFRVTFSFNNEVSSQHIRLFNDARRLTYEHARLHASLDGGTSKYFAAWGDQSFTSGKQYWEMLMDSSWDWAVGICKDSWIRKDDGILDESNRDNFLLVCVKQDDHYQLWTTAPTTPLYIERPQGRVGVFLDCDSGSISFVDVAKRTLLWRYDDGVCTFPVRPFICTGHR